MLNITAAADVAQTGLPGLDQAIVMIVFVLVASLGIITPVAVYLAMGDRSESMLAEWKTWLSANNATVMFVLFLVFGFVLVGKGIGGLS